MRGEGWGVRVGGGIVETLVILHSVRGGRWEVILHSMGGGR